MVLSLRQWIKRVKFIVLFILLTYLISLLFQRVSLWVEPDHKYDRPMGEAVKVTLIQDGHEHESSMLDRLRFFYWYGE